MADVTLDSPGLSQADFRALREGRAIPDKQPEPDKPKPSETKVDEAAAAAQPPAPADTPVESAAESETAEVPEDQSEPHEKPKPKRGLVDEISKLRREKRELEARLQSLQPPRLPAPAVPKPPATEPEPDPSKYTDYGVLMKDQIKHGIRATLAELSAADAAARVEAEQRAKEQTWLERVNAAKAAHADYDAVARDPNYPVTPDMAAAITDSDLGTEILYHLGSHRDEAARIAKLSPVAQVREIGKLEAALSKAAADESAAGDEETPEGNLAVSKAPAPIPKPAAGAPRSNPARNFDAIKTQAEFRALRESGRLR